MDPFYVTVPTDPDTHSDPDVHEVVLDEDKDFLCNDCGANGLTDGFLISQSGAQEWHDSL